MNRTTLAELYQVYALGAPGWLPVTQRGPEHAFYAGALLTLSQCCEWQPGERAEDVTIDAMEAYLNGLLDECREYFACRQREENKRT